MASNRNDLIVVGDSFVGKSSLISRMLKKSFDCTKVTATVGVAFRSLDFEYNSLKLKMAIWDTSGYKTNESLNTIYCHHSIAAIVVYDVTNRNSFQRVDYWINFVKKCSQRLRVITLVGNKVDLRKGNQKTFVSRKEGADLAMELRVNFYETSAKSGLNVEELFSETCEQIVLSSAPIQLRTVSRKFKFIMLGSSGVGKTSIYERLNGKEFSLNKTVTTEVVFSKIKRTVNAQTFEIDLWDTFGQERFEAMMGMYYRGADAAIITYDINDRTSFDGINYWFKQLEEKVEENIPVVLLANKSDIENKRQVETEEGQRLLEVHKKVCEFAEVSAKNDTNFEYFLDILIVKILDVKNEISQSASIQLNNNNETGKKDKKHCCR